MLTYNLTNTGSDPLYLYLYKCIKKDIREGKLKAGEKLPSKRAFAKNLGISVITVEGAYGQLMAEGYLYSIPKSGFFIADLKEDKKRVSATKREQVTLTSGENRYLADFTSNQTEQGIFPFSIWSKIMRKVLSEQQEKIMINPPCGGTMELRNCIATYLQEFRGMKVEAEQIIIGAGTEYLYGLLIQLLGNRAIYGVEDPGYQKISRIYQSMQVRCEPIEIDQMGVRVSELEEKQVDIVHISPAHHFPTGQVMPISRRYEILGWAAAKEGRYIIEDDYDSELRLSGRPIPTLQSIDVSEKVIYMNTFSKTLCSTVRISYMVLPRALSDLFYQKLSFYSCTVSNFEQYTLAEFMREGYFEKHINRLRSYYQKKRDRILEVFQNSPLQKRVIIREADAGVHFLMEIQTGLPEEDILKKAKAKGIRLVPMSDFYQKGRNDREKNVYVMNYSFVQEEKMEEIVQILYGIIK